MAKADLILEAKNLGLEVDETMTAKEIQEKIDAFNKSKAPIKPEKPHYEEWDVKISYNKETKEFTYDKLKMKRPRVLIADHQAEILNEGVLNGGNTYAVMYFPAE